MTYKFISKPIIGKNIKIIKKYKSRKNNVYLVYLSNKDRTIKAIYKKFNHLMSRNKEYKILKDLQQKRLNVPKIYFTDEDVIIKEYIDGVTLLHMINTLENKQKKEFDLIRNRYILTKITSWMNEFYMAINQITGSDIIIEDINFRNFIMKDNIIYGVDFEDCHKGYRERDGGRFCAFLLTYKPAYTKWKISITKLLFKILLDKYKYNRKLLINEFNKELIEIEKRRKLKTPIKINERIINDI